MGKKDKLSIRKIQNLLRFARQVVRGVACHAMYYEKTIPQALKQFT